MIYHMRELAPNTANIVLILTIVGYVLFLICTFKNNKFGKYNITSEDESSITIYLGKNFIKYMADDSYLNLQRRINDYIEEFKCEKGYYFKKPNIVISTDIKQNEVLIRDRDFIDRQVSFTTFENCIFSFDNLYEKNPCTVNYPIFCNPVYIYKKDNYSVRPIEIWKNDFANAVSDTQILDLIISAYSAFALNSFVFFNDEFSIIESFETFSSFCENNADFNDLADDEDFFAFILSIIDTNVLLNNSIKSIDEIILFAKKILELDTDDEEKSLINELMKNEKFKNSFINAITENEKVYAYTLSDKFIDEINSINGGDVEDDKEEAKQIKYNLLDRVVKGVKENLRLIILCDDENDKITNHIHSKKDALLRLENIGEISRISAETIDDMLGFDEKTRSKLNKTVFDVSGDLIAEKQR